ncbi:tetraspanin-9-like [Clytia hemisphaerica]|uniref:tetraspanin-9-like n=1 Tax=Clytia hemisphaerica TaxID=252671 RepID=UPI0034D502C5
MGFQEFSRFTNDFDYNGDRDDRRQNHSQEKQTYLQNMVMNVGECGFKCIRTTFFVYNLLLWMVGFLVLFLAAVLHTTRNEASNDFTKISGLQGYLNGPIILLVVGSVTLLLSFMACFGSRRNNLVLLILYLVVLIIITATELGLIILVYSFRVPIEKSLKMDFQKTLNQYGIPSNERITTAIDALQREFHCCGNDGYGDWVETTWWNQYDGNYSVPTSCCVIPRMKNCNKNVDKKLETIFTEGCYEDVKKYLFENIHIIGGFAVWIVVLEVVGILLAVALVIKIRQNNRMQQTTLNGDSSYHNLTGDIGY